MWLNWKAYFVYAVMEWHVEHTCIFCDFLRKSNFYSNCFDLRCLEFWTEYQGSFHFSLLTYAIKNGTSEILWGSVSLVQSEHHVWLFVRWKWPSLTYQTFRERPLSLWTELNWTEAWFRLGLNSPINLSYLLAERAANVGLCFVCLGYWSVVMGSFIITLK